MNFEPNEDLALFQAAIERLADRYRLAWTPGAGRHEHARALEAELREGDFFAASAEPALGPVAAASMVLALAQLPVCAEVAASALIAPQVCPGLGGPLAVVCGDLARPTRYLADAVAVLHLGPQRCAFAALRGGEAEVLDSTFAYPMGRLAPATRLDWRALDDERAAELRRLWSLAVCAEIVGCLQAGLDTVVEHVKERRQFGRALGTFQGIQHRLAGAASTIQAAHWLTLKAADSGAALDAATALGHAQGSAAGIVYDLHQFMGAMGLTLEHPLHRWTYRLKLLRSELGGVEQQFQQAAELAWAAA